MTEILLLLVLFGSTYGLEIRKHSLNYEDEDMVGIFNGNTTSISENPWVGSVMIMGEYMGCAVVLSKMSVMTVALVVSGIDVNYIQIRLGSNSYGEDGQVLQAASVTIQVDYNGGYVGNIAIINTTEPIKFSKKTRKSKLGEQEMPGGTEATVVGWGVYNDTWTPSYHLLAANVTTIDGDTCSQSYPNLGPAIMCTQANQNGPTTFDFGCPLVARKTVYGLYAGSNNEPSQNNSWPIVYTNISNYIDWIKNNMYKKQN